MDTRPYCTLLVRAALVGMTVMLITAAFWLVSQPGSKVVNASATTVIGTPIPNLSSLETTLFNTGFQPFNKNWDPQQGLGPVYTMVGCPLCHSDPNLIAGGNSKQKVTFVGKINSDGSYNDLSSEGGPQMQPNSVQKFKSTCNLAGEVVPSDATIVAKHQTPQLFGMGLIDNIPDSSITAQAVPKPFGVNGIVNLVPDENGKLRPGRFGQKSQAADLLQMTAFAEVHELGITNPIVIPEDLPQGKSIPQFCSIKAQPNDDGSQMVPMYHYLVYLAPATPGSGNTNGQALFNSIGCAECHVPTYTTSSTVTVLEFWNGASINSTALANQPVNLYSDLLLHDMGSFLADGLQAGQASGSQFRTAPLWGLSQRIMSGDGLLHDGRATNVTAAILDHSLHGDGEALQIVNKFKALSSSDQSDLIAFISSL